MPSPRTDTKPLHILVLTDNAGVPYMLSVYSGIPVDNIDAAPTTSLHDTTQLTHIICLDSDLPRR